MIIVKLTEWIRFELNLTAFYFWIGGMELKPRCQELRSSRLIRVSAPICRCSKIRNIKSWSPSCSRHSKWWRRNRNNAASRTSKFGSPGLCTVLPPSFPANGSYDWHPKGFGCKPNHTKQANNQKKSTFGPDQPSGPKVFPGVNQLHFLLTNHLGKRPLDN